MERLAPEQVTPCDRSGVRAGRGRTSITARCRRLVHRALPAALLVVALAAVPLERAAEAARPIGQQGRLHQTSPSGRAFFRGKTITFIVPGNVGGTVDTSMRLIVPAMESYLGATINLENITAGNGIPAQDDAAAAPPDGLTVSWLDVGSDVSALLLRLPSLNFNPLREAFIGGYDQGVSAWVSQPGGPLSSWSAVVNSKVPVSMCDITTGTADLYLRIVNGVFGIDARVITGFASNSSLLLGFLNNDSAVEETSILTLGSVIEGGKAVPLLITTKPPAGASINAYLRGVPTIATLVKEYRGRNKDKLAQLAVLQDLLTIENPLYVPSATPGDRVAALRAAMDFAAHQPSVIAGAATQGLVVHWVPGPQAKSAFVEILGKGKSFANYLAPG